MSPRIQLSAPCAAALYRGHAELGPSSHAHSRCPPSLSLLPFPLRSPCLTLGTDCSRHFCCDGLGCSNSTSGPPVCAGKPDPPSALFIGMDRATVNVYVTPPNNTGGPDVGESGACCTAWLCMQSAAHWA